MSAQQKNSTTSFVKNLVLGGASGCTAKTICAPLERVKIVLQTAKAGSGATMAGTGQQIVAEQGVAALWRGNLTNCARYFPTQAINFACKESYQKALVPNREEAGFAKWFIGYLAAGGLAGATSLTVVYPLEFSYTRLAADVGTKKQFSGLTDVVTSIYKAEGLKGLYRGYGPSVAGIIVYRAGYFGFYDAGKQIFFEDGGQNTNILLKFGLAMGVDISAAVFAYPIDTVRRRLMMQSGAGEAAQFTSASSAVSYIYRQEGVGGFYRGCMANNVRAIASALVLVLYDEAKKVMG
jgi:solute carrier family 25 (adenine nucleotide translocator) protein 4/5/6/31